MHENQDSIALITGASAGIGLELARKLLSENWQVIALNRSVFPAEDTLFQSALDAGRLRMYKVADLSDYSDLRRALEELKAAENRIDVLFNNAGGSFPELAYSRQGREKHYELMTVAPYIILMELKELLKNGRVKTVINTSSSALKYTKELSIEMLERPAVFRKLLGPYAASKLALSLWTEAAAPLLARDGIKLRSVDPGSNNTLRKGKKSGLPLLIFPLMKFFFSPPSHGASLLYEAAFGEHQDRTGIFILKGQPAELKFEAQGPLILQRLNELYQQEYLGARV